MMTLSELLSDIKTSYCTGLLEYEGSKWYYEKYPLGIFMGKPIGDEKYENICFHPGIPKIPRSVLYKIIDYFQKDLDKEAVVQILYGDDGFFINYPCIQHSTKASISYSFQIPIGVMLVMTIHSHNTMPAFFSLTDDIDEVITGLYGVIGNFRGQPQIMLRASLNGSFGSIPIQGLFS